MTSTYNPQLIRDKLIESNGKPLDERLSQLVRLFADTWQTKLYFCRLHGKRWSHYVGIDNFVVPEKKIELNRNFGLIIGNSAFTDAQWDEIAALFTEQLDLS